MRCVGVFYFLLLAKVLGFSWSASVSQETGLDAINIKEDEFETTEDLIQQAGYGAETHQVLTEDGFFIRLFRIKSNSTLKNDISNEILPVVVLQHGMLCSSSDWVFAGPKRGLGFVLADSGFDVWLTNVRGNLYGRNHTNASMKFSFHEMGQYDIPTQLDYILNETKVEKVHYIGYSMGTTAFYVMLSEKPEYNSKVKAMISLAPISFLGNVKGFVIKFIKWINSLFNKLLQLFGIDIVFPHPIKFNNHHLSDNPILEYVYLLIMGSLGGFNSEQYDEELVSSYLRHVPAGTSWKVAQHYFQLMNSNRFHKFDYGPLKNEAVYGTTVAPDYNLTNIHLPIVLIQGKNDYLSTPEDVEKLRISLNQSSALMQYIVGDPNFTHFDFMWAKDIHSLLHEFIVDILKVLN